MAKKAVRSITIDAPVEKVFSFLSDPTHWMLAFPGDSEVTDLKIMPDGTGTWARWSAKMFGINMSVTHEYREVVPEKLIVSKASVGPVLTFSLEPAGDGTQLDFEQSFDIQTPFVRVPVQALFARWSEHDIDALMANIKSMVESGEKTVTESRTAGLPHTLTWADEISIGAPVQRVFDLVKDPSVWLGPDVKVSNVKPTSEGVGTTFEVAWKVLGIPLKTTHEYTEFVPGEHFTSKSALGPVFNVAVAPENGGTRLRMRSEVVPANWGEAAVDSLVIKMSEHSQARLLASIKAAAEAGGGVMPAAPSEAVDNDSILKRYDAVLRGGAENYRDGRDLLPLLTDDFVFEGPIAGRIPGGTRFLHGVRGFIETVRKVTVLQTVTGVNGAAVLYDAELPGGVVRFSEFFKFDNGKIRELRIQYDAADYVAKGGR